ncbi:MAG: NAD-binding protein [Candidatus Limiplasma sp.]|nr:NAD-binding protein [Candidatus Limiplasma sp.]
MAVLLLMVSIGVVLYGYLLVRRLDRFIQRGGIVQEPAAMVRKEILLYGGKDAVGRIARALDEAAITYDRTAEMDVRNGAAYDWVGAFSESDADNLLFCLLAKRKNERIHTLAECNDRMYENVFKQAGITAILPKNAPVDQILACLKG